MKGIKSRISWKLESFRKGRAQLFKMKIRGKTICLYCALDPSEFDKAKYFHERADAKAFSAVPMLVRIRSDRGLKKALSLIDTVMEKFTAPMMKDHADVDYSQEYHYETTKRLIERDLIKLLFPGATAKEPKVQKTTVTVEKNNTVEELTLLNAEGISPIEIAEAISAPRLTLEGISATATIPDEDAEGSEIIGVAFEDGDIRIYDPTGEIISTGDVVLVRERDSESERQVIKRGVAAYGNRKIKHDMLVHPPKRIIGVLRRKSK